MVSRIDYANCGNGFRVNSKAKNESKHMSGCHTPTQGKLTPSRPASLLTRPRMKTATQYACYKVKFCLGLSASLMARQQSNCARTGTLYSLSVQTPTNQSELWTGLHYFREVDYNITRQIHAIWNLTTLDLQ